MIITSDHGNAEQMENPDNSPHTSHTTNPVYFIAVNKQLYESKEKLTLDKLSDIAPYILKRMHLPIPKEMLKS